MAELDQFPSIKFGLEMALLDLRNGGKRILYESDWTKGQTGIVINGLVWMGSLDEMTSRVAQKIQQGFRCIKFKIGGIDFESELKMIEAVRKNFSMSDLEIRLDANGAFKPSEVFSKLDRLSQFDIHSIEQPIKPKQWNVMENICRRSPIPIALDEELIGLNTQQDREVMIEIIKPQYIILKPSLCGGISGSKKWIEIAQRNSVGWWATSALESNVGLNAIAQWVSTQNTKMPQGLGTGALYTNNINSPIRQTGQILTYDPNDHWDFSQLNEWICPN
ncbi:MAG: o-succinylbenzoate synthase [Bacteroides sp.]|nr:o-succinylbenzoate synthase [Bacteroides sp.]